MSTKIISFFPLREVSYYEALNSNLLCLTTPDSQFKLVPAAGVRPTSTQKHKESMAVKQVSCLVEFVYICKYYMVIPQYNV